MYGFSGSQVRHGSLSTNPAHDLRASSGGNDIQIQAPEFELYRPFEVAPPFDSIMNKFFRKDIRAGQRPQTYKICSEWLPGNLNKKGFCT